MRFKNNKQVVIKRFMTGAILATFFWLSFTYLPYWVFSMVLFAIMSCIIVFEWQRLFDVYSISFWLFLPFYPILPFLLLMYMNNVALYRDLIFILFMMVSAHDTAAYIIGSLWGKHALAPYISPGKTWEGFLGGCIAACFGLWIALWELNVHKTAFFVIIAALVVSVLSLAGDLFESWLKRRAHIKDTGNLLPGHGGFLDRFDGILFAVFFFYYYRDWLLALLFEPLSNR